MATPEVGLPSTHELNPGFSISASQQKEIQELPSLSESPTQPKPTLLNYREQEKLPMINPKKIMPKPVPLPVKVQSLNEQIDLKKAKKAKGISHKKRHNKGKKKAIRKLMSAGETLVERKILDGFLLLHSCRVKNPQQAVKSKLSGENIVEVEEGDLLFFPNLAYLNISENKVRIEQLANLKALRELHIQYNFIKSLQIEAGMFPSLEILSLGFNSVPAGHILQLSQLQNLRVLDLSGNELCILPEDLGTFTKLEELNLSSNNFSSDSVVVEPGRLFKSLSSIPHLKRLNLAHNALKGFHFEYLNGNNIFDALTELDFSYNKVTDQENLLFCQKLKSLQVLIITGNPIGINNEYKELEQALYHAISAVVVNHPTSPPNYLRKHKENRKDLLKKLPYPKPIASIMSDTTKDVVTKHLYEAELSKGIAVPLGEIEPSKEGEEEIFPEGSKQNRQHTDIFTPPETAQREKKFFVTENDAQNQPPVEKEETEDKKEEFPEPDAKEGEEEQQEENGENLEPNENEPEDIDAEYGIKKIRDFMMECREFLGDTKQYNAVMPISLACKALKHSLKFPTTFVGSEENHHYMKSTLASMISKSLKHQSKAINFKEMQSIFLFSKI